jgi:hypothetical protein
MVHISSRDTAKSDDALTIHLVSGNLHQQRQSLARRMGGHDMQRILQEKEFLQKAQAALEAETEEMYQVSNRLNDNLVKAFRLMWRQLFFIWAVVIVLGVSFFFGLRTSSLPGYVDTQALTTLEQPPLNLPLDALPQGSPPQTSRESKTMLEGEKVREILEQIRQAQLTKDINLFLKAYAPSFPNLNQKKGSVLKTWQQYDYLDLRFQVENIHQKDAHTIVARVTWDITLREVRSRKKRTVVKNFTVHFSNSSGKWLLQELIEGIDPRYARQGWKTGGWLI